MKRKILCLLLFLLGFIQHFVAQGNMTLKFSSNDDYVNVKHFDIPEAITIESWIKTTQNNTGTIVSWKDAVNNGNAFLIRIYGGKLQLGEWFGGWREYNTSIKVNSGSWVHIAAVRSNTTLKLFVNGEEVLNDNPQKRLSECKTTALSLGAIQTNALGAVNKDESFIGEIDEVRIWDKELSGTEIASNMRKSIPSNSENLVAYFNCDNNVDDKSLNSNNGNIKGNVSYVDSDIFTSPFIKSIKIKESDGQVPTIVINNNSTGTVYWIIRTSKKNEPNNDEILNGLNSDASGRFNCLNANLDSEVLLKSKLAKGAEYCIYAILKTGAEYSEVYKSDKYQYLALHDLPLNWYNQDIGAVNVSGNAKYENDKFIVSGAGSDIWSTKDAFHYAYTTAEGDTEFIAKIESQENTHDWARTGLMIREGFDNNSAFVMIGVTPNNGIHYTYRNEKGWWAKMQSCTKSKNSPIWLRIVYKDGYALTYWSEDRNQWNRLKYPVRLKTNKTYYVGFASCSHNENKLCKVEYSNVQIKTPAEDIVINEKGAYFEQKEYINDPIPIFSKDKDKLPIPILDNNQDWIDMYWKAWDLAFKHIIAPVKGSNYISNFYDEAFNDDIFQWDIIFMTLFGKYANHLFPAVHSFNNFYANQHKDGLIVRQLSSKGDDTIIGDSVLIFPPLFSWAEMENYMITPDKERLRAVLPVLEKYFEYIEGYHRGWDTKHQLYWTHGYASGMDNTPRDNGREHGHMSFDHQGWTDLSCQMVIQCNNIALMCKELGETQKEKYYEAKAKEIGDRINQYMWNEADGLYYDVNVESEQTYHKTAACFWPMLAGITTQSQNDKMVANLKDPKTFWRDIVFPTLAADQPEYKNNGGYWHGGVWAPTNYAIIKGLSKQGYHSFAKEASEKYIKGMYEVYKKTGTIWENYAPEIKNGVYMQGVRGENTENFCRYDFVGWSGLGPIALLIEDVIGINVDGLNNTVDWYLERTDRNGIENIRFGNVITSMICKARDSKYSEANIVVTSDNPYKLNIHIGDEKYVYDIKSGENILKVTTGIRKNKMPGGSIKVYPNPTNDKLNINLENQEDCFVEIHTTDGILVYNEIHNKSLNMIDLKKFPVGEYILTYKQNDIVNSEKIIIKK